MGFIDKSKDKSLLFSASNFLTVQEVSELLKLSVITLYKYIREAKLEAIEFGGHYRIPISSLEKFINDHKVSRPILGTKNIVDSDNSINKDETDT